MIRLKGLDIVLTYECTGRCAHCCYRAGPGRNQTMRAKDVERYLAGAANHPLEYVLLFGGEPFVCFDLLKASVTLASSLARVLVFTNGVNFSLEMFSFLIDPGKGNSMCCNPEVTSLAALNGSSAPLPSSTNTNSSGRSLRLGYGL